MQLLTRPYANLPVALKLATGFAVLITLTIATGLVGVQALNQYGESATVVARTSAIESALLSARTEEKNFLLRNDPAFVQTAREHLDTASAIARELSEQLTGNRADLLDNILEGSARYGELLTQVSGVMAEKDKAQEQLVLDGRILEAQINAEDRLYLATATFKQMRREEQDFLLTGNRDALTQFDDRLGRAQASIRSSALDQDEKDEISSLFDSYASAFQATAAHIQRTNVLEGEMVKTARASLEASDALQDHQVRQMAVDRRQAMLTIAVSTAVVIALGVVLAWLLTRTITRPIREAVAIAQNVADGDLRTRVHNDRTDELGKLLSALGAMVTNLRDLVHRIDTNATDVAASSGQLSAVTEQNRQGAADQRDQTDQVATAMNQMVATVNDVARSAESAASAAADASQKAGDGEHAVNDTLTLVGDLSNQVQQAMGRLRTLQSDTHNINTVLDVIKSVAEQTNLLALNAAIEAARAGQHGRGFAVVADEVRSLAQRTQTSAAEIEELITNLVTSAEETVAVMETSTGLASRTLESANTTGETIRQMTRAVENITQLNQQIATAAEEQTSVAEDVNLNITLIRDFSDQTATSTEQVSSASADLARLGEELRSQVARFQV